MLTLDQAGVKHGSQPDTLYISKYDFDEALFAFIHLEKHFLPSTSQEVPLSEAALYCETDEPTSFFDVLQECSHKRNKRNADAT